MAKDASELIKKYASASINSASQAIAQASLSPVQRFHSCFTVPILYGFVKWTLLQAEKNQVYDLYFLSRDGYIPYKIASLLCERHSLPFRCHYLFGSRTAWRLPSYHILNKEELRSILFVPSLQMTPSSLLSRAGFSEEEQKYFFKKTSFSKSNINQILSKSEMELFADELLNILEFQQLVQKKSRNAYVSTMAYFKQEGLLDKNKFAIVDTGWTGSMQRTLRQLLSYDGHFPKIYGFYFGMYDTPKSVEDGFYSGWYFQPQIGFWRTIMFNNNLLETLCLAPDPMTIGYYQSDNGLMQPKFVEHSSNNNNKKECADLLKICTSFSDKAPFELPLREWFCLSKKLLSKVSINPSTGDVNAVSRYRFCDDPMEGYCNSIAAPLTKKQLKSYLFLRRLCKKVFLKKELPPLFWPQGSLAVSDVSCKMRYRFSFFLWETLRQLKILLKRKREKR